MTLPPYRTDRYPSDEESLSDASYIASFATPPTKFNAAGDARCTSAVLAPGRQTAEDTADIHKSGVVKAASSWAAEAASSACAAARRNDVAAPKVDDSAGVAEALLKLQKKLSLLSHERALAERDLNALSDELSHGRSRRSRQRAGWMPPDGRQDDGYVRQPSYFRPDDEDDCKVSESHTRHRMSSASLSGPPASSRRSLQHRAAGSGRTDPSDANDDGSTAIVAPAPQQFPISAAGDLSEVDGGGEHDQPSRATRRHIDVYVAAAVAEQLQEEEETAPSADMNDAHADLSAAEARCLRLDARLALMRRALHTATSDERRGPSGGGSREQHCACGKVDCGSAAPGDRCIRIAPPSLRRAPTAGAAVSATKAVTRSGQRPRHGTPSTTASRPLRKGSASMPRAADVGAATFAEQQDAAATKSSSAATTLRAARGRRGPTAPTLSSAAPGLVRHSTVAASSSAGCSRLSSQHKVACSERALVSNSSLAHRAVVVRSGGPGIKTTWQDHQEHSDQEAARPVAPYEGACCSGRWLADGGNNPASRLRRLREEFTHLNREHRQLTLLVGDAIAAGRPSVDLERELDHLVERMDVKGDEIAQCVRTFTDVCQPPRVIVASAGDVTCQAAGRCKWPAEESESSGPAAAVAHSTTASSSRRRRTRSVAGAKSKAARSGRLEGGISGSGSRRRRPTKAVCAKAKVVLLCRSRKPGGGGSHSAALQLRRSKLEGRPDSDRVQHRVSWA